MKKKPVRTSREGNRKVPQLVVVKLKVKSIYDRYRSSSSRACGGRGMAF